jgi:uncharacterized protein YndB with AHSA1/START domain
MNACDARAEMLIRSSAQSCFDAFVNPDTIVKFWLDKTSAPIKPGAIVTWQFMVRGAEETVTVTAFEAPHRLAFSWSDGMNVTMAFKPHGSGAPVVRLVASGLKKRQKPSARPKASASCCVTSRCCWSQVFLPTWCGTKRR